MSDHDDNGNRPTAAPQHTVLDDLELKSPLSKVKGDISWRDRSVFHPLLCRMFVACRVLKLSSEARFTSLVLLHRYFDVVDDLSVDIKWVAAACLFLGTKTEEESRRLRDIINLVQILSFGTPGENIHVKEVGPLDENYWSSKDMLIKTEQEVLRILRFNVSVSHPHRAVAVLLSQEAGFYSQQQDLLRISWQHLNQALFYDQALRYDVLSLACASIECARLKLNPREESQSIAWWQKYGVSNDELQSCIKDLSH
jgi:hypothetical protein